MTFGISCDSDAVLKKFAEEENYGYDLLWTTGRTVEWRANSASSSRIKGFADSRYFRHRSYGGRSLVRHQRPWRRYYSTTTEGTSAL